MPKRITIKELEQVVARLNRTLGQPECVFAFDSYGDMRRNPDGSPVQNNSTICIGQAYGGYRLESHAGGREISGRGTARETYTFAQAMIVGAQLMLTD